MAPIRRYLRISKHSVLECRIFLENPADGPRWLLNPQDPALKRVFEAIRPLILPKLREENERARGKGKKKKSVKDVVKADDFEVSIFLTEITTRHSLLVKNKTLNDQDIWANNRGGRTGQESNPVLIREEDDQETVALDGIPASNNGIDEDDETATERTHTDEADAADDKKKLGFKTTYDGFSIWGKVLCLLVDRKGGLARKPNDPASAQALMQDWISTQQQVYEDE